MTHHTAKLLPRVVITGLGLVTPLGCGTTKNLENLMAGLTGIRVLESDAYSKLPCRIAGLIPDEDLQQINSKFTDSERRSASPAILYGLIAAEEALQHSGLLKSVTDEGRARIGVCVGMGISDLQDVYETGNLLFTRGYNRVTPYFIPRILPNLCAGQISIKYNLHGPNHCASTACASGAHGIGDAFNLIRLGYADAIICGGAEAPVNPLTIASFCRLRALATKYNEKPEQASRPFDAKRDGFVMGEGAGIMILEDLEHALKRNATILGEIIGYGLSGDGSHLTAAREDGLGAFNAMKQALQVAKVEPKELSFVNCHATSTPIGDKAEVTALRRLFNNKSLNDVPLSANKGAIGHLLGAAGAVEAVLSVLACKNGLALPCINVDEIDPECEGVNIVTTAKNMRLQPDSKGRVIALKNSFGFGGTNASLCISNYVE